MYTIALNILIYLNKCIMLNYVTKFYNKLFWFDLLIPNKINALIY